MAPMANTRLQFCSRQSYLKNSTPMDFGWEMAHRWRRLEEIPNERLPIQIMSGTMRPMMGPATYHGQGDLSQKTRVSIFCFLVLG